MDNDSYLKTLRNSEAWFEQAFAQKMVADKILVDVIMSEDFVVLLKEDESKLMDFVTLWGECAVSLRYWNRKWIEGCNCQELSRTH